MRDNQMSGVGEFSGNAKRFSDFSGLHSPVKRCQRVLVYSPDRLARDPCEITQIVNVLRQRGIVIEFVQGSIPEAMV